MSINKNTMEVTRKIDQKVCYYDPHLEHTEDLLYNLRTLIFDILIKSTGVTLSEAYQYLKLEKSKESFTLGWEYGSSVEKREDLFTWAFCADGTIEVTFRNLKDITDLYETEEELA